MRPKLLIGVAAFVVPMATCYELRGQDDVQKATPSRSRIAGAAPARIAQRSATIHWQRVPLRDAVGPLHALFDDTIFVDRRIDPNTRISLDIEATSAEEVATAIAAGRDWAVARLGRLVFLGPSSAAVQLRAVAAARSQEVARLSAETRASLTRKQKISWPRLGEPRGAIAAIVEHHGWQLANADAIPHDLWSAGSLPEMSLAEQLTVLLVGFDLSFELRPNDRSIEIVPLKEGGKVPEGKATTTRSAKPQNSTRTMKETKQLYTLRVQEKPVGAVIRELSKRLHWAIQIDENGIKAAGKSLDERVSFSVENADKEHLLEALLKPAGLEYQLVGDQIRIVAARYDAK